ncbi:Hypothetical_protein [Hexamita inflata]|uniref:Hypothetical_protein n=1 Tax=Hexamita inflata TaxID=28002 RepID=A0AA86PT57_9EUKA|nr:Hypothetical protein HINF_LOCUS33500 [Hexamita inflata]
MKQYQFTRSQDEERYSLIQKYMQTFCKIIATKVYLLRTLATQSQILLLNQKAQAKRRLVRVQWTAELMFVKNRKNGKEAQVKLDFEGVVLKVCFKTRVQTEIVRLNFKITRID